MNLFGTDGIRGRYGVEPLTLEGVKRLAEAIGQVFAKHSCPSLSKILIAEDTRFSCRLIADDLEGPLRAHGFVVEHLGVIPAPALVQNILQNQATLGIMISASHNPAEDNGLKIFMGNGEKVDDQIIQEIENVYRSLGQNVSQTEETDKLSPAAEMYISFLRGTLPRVFSLRGLKVVIDGAHGAAFQVGPVLLKRLEAQVVMVGCEPNGLNINAHCGALEPQLLQEAVLRERADLGIALDGDGDRVLLVDGTGALVDGDQMLALLALQWVKEGKLITKEIVSTVMANGALETFLANQGLTLLRTPVGDRFVMACMKEKGLPLGAEPSGHVILRDFQTSGDGLLTALQILRILQDQGKRADQVFPLFPPFPTILKNIEMPPSGLLKTPETQAFFSQINDRLSVMGGRLLIRPSGTEPLLRIFMEGPEKQELAAYVDQIVCWFKKSRPLARLSKEAYQTKPI